jgi:hypothetical protein
VALLEADVHFRVVKEFLAAVEQKALGGKVLESLSPAQQVIAIVRDELTATWVATTPRSSRSTARRRWCCCAVKLGQDDTAGRSLSAGPWPYPCCRGRRGAAVDSWCRPAAGLIRS